MYDEQPTEPSRWGTRIALISAALTVAAVVIGGIVVARNTDGFITITDGEPEAGQLALPGDVVAQSLAAPPFSYTFHGYTAGALMVTEPVLATAGYQEAQVRGPDEVAERHDDDGAVAATLPAYGALLTVYRPGVFDPARFLGQEAILVGGRKGYWAAHMPYREGEVVDGSNRPGLAWEYADGAWAVISSVRAETYPRKDLLAVAAGLTTVEAYPATTPIDLVTVPDGYTLTSGGAVGDWPNGALFMAGSVRLSTQRPEYRELTAPVDAAAAGPTIQIAIYDAAWAKEIDGLEAGRPASCVREGLCVKLSADGRWLTEAHAEGGKLKEELLKRVLDDAVMADVPHRDTWFPLTEAAS